MILSYVFSRTEEGSNFSSVCSGLNSNTFYFFANVAIPKLKLSFDFPSDDLEAKSTYGSDFCSIFFASGSKSKSSMF